MNCNKIKIAGIVLEIEDDSFPATGFFSDFCTDEIADVKISAVIDEQLRNTSPGHENEIIGLQYISTGSLFFQRIYQALLEYHIMLIHGAAIALDGKAYVFAAPSGTGKTTHILKWLDKLHNAFVVNGDKPLIKFPSDGGQPMVCGSPWCGKEKLGTNTMVPLKSIILMERAEENHIEQISFAQAFPTLLQQVYRPYDEEKMRKTLRLMQRLSPAVSFWRFQCNNFKDDCFDVAYNALVKSQS